MKLLKSYSYLAVVFSIATLFSCSKENTDDSAPLVDSEVAQSSSQIIPGQYIVVYNKSENVKGDISGQKRAVQDKTKDLFTRNNIAGAEVLHVYSSAVSGVAVKLSVDEATRLKNDKEVVFMEPDRIVTLGKPTWAGGGGSTSSGQEKPYGILRVNGGAGTPTGRAWIIDTGIDLDHPDLNVDANSGFNAFTSGKDAKSLDDGNGHGSHVSGTIAAIDNDFGVIGVVPGATVIPVKVLDSRGSGSYSGVIAGVDFVAAHGKAGDVANMSLGGPVSDLLDNAVINAAGNGIKFALAAGNESEDSNLHSPARAEGTNIYTISAMDNTDTWASFSNFGTHVDYCAPGVNIKSTWKDGGYNTISGTSMASPHAAGVLLLGNFGTDGNVISDPDGNADPIMVH